VKRALIVVDVQKDFLPGGALAVPNGDQVIPVINALLDRPYSLIVFTQDWHPADHGSFASVAKVPLFSQFKLNGLDQVAWPDHCVQGSPGAEFAAALVQSPVGKPTRIFRKGTDASVDSYSGFYDNGKKNSTGLAEYLKQMDVTDVDVCGLATDYCVGWTAEDAVALGLKVRVVVDASRGIGADSTEKMLERLESLGCKVVGSGEI
jgi:nicotinamidase/pyrazinamidase